MNKLTNVIVNIDFSETSREVVAQAQCRTSLGANGKSNLSCVMLDSTVERLLEGIPCSALVVRPPDVSERVVDSASPAALAAA